jgi:hypothetical protein
MQLASMCVAHRDIMYACCVMPASTTTDVPEGDNVDMTDVKMATINPFSKLQRKINQICKNFTI